MAAGNPNWVKGMPKPPGSGRAKGALNKATSVKKALEEAFEQLGGVAALVTYAKENPGAFYSLWIKLLPKVVETIEPETYNEAEINARLAVLEAKRQRSLQAKAAEETSPR